jgi:hypothetical protein
MKRRLRVLIVFAGVIAMVMALNVGAASAHDADNPNSAFYEAEHKSDVMLTPSPKPVGSHLLDPAAPGHPGSENGFQSDSEAQENIWRNPNCPAHYA